MFGNVHLAFGTILENLWKSSESGRKSSENHQKRRRQYVYIINIEYFMESARVRCLHTSCGVSEIDLVSEANEWDFWYKTTSV